MTFFHLDEEPGLVRFHNQLAARVGGKVVAPPDVDSLGAAVVGEYPPHRRVYNAAFPFMSRACAKMTV